MSLRKIVKKKCRNGFMKLRAANGRSNKIPSETTMMRKNTAWRIGNATTLAIRVSRDTLPDGNYLKDRF